MPPPVLEHYRAGEAGTAEGPSMYVPRRVGAKAEGGITGIPALLVRPLDPTDNNCRLLFILVSSQTTPWGQEWLKTTLTKPQGQSKKPRGPCAPDALAYQSQTPTCSAGGAGVSVLEGGNREASVPSGSCLASRMPICSVARFSVPGDATHRNIS